MFEGPAIVIVWLMTPAIVAIGSFGAGLAFCYFQASGRRMRRRRLGGVGARAGNCEQVPQLMS
jgi:hypothetical protein